MSTATVRILGLGGGLRVGSRSLTALKEALAFAEDQGAETRLIDLNEVELPLYRPDNATPAAYGAAAAPAIEELLDGLRWADSYLWASPSYHGSLSGAVKNALDYVQFLVRDTPSFLYGKTVGIISAGAGAIAAVNVVTQLTQVAHGLRAQVVPLAVPIVSAGKAFEDGQLTDTQVRERLNMLTTELVALARVQAERRLVTA
jgi:FMN reductase